MQSMLTHLAQHKVVCAIGTQVDAIMQCRVIGRHAVTTGDAAVQLCCINEFSKVACRTTAADNFESDISVYLCSPCPCNASR